jgi:hypothetical protein
LLAPSNNARRTTEDQTMFLSRNTLIDLLAALVEFDNLDAEINPSTHVCDSEIFDNLDAEINPSTHVCGKY